MVLVAMDLFGEATINFHLHRAIGTNGQGLLEHQFGGSHAAVVPPWRTGADATPISPAGIPETLGKTPPVARSIKPIPRHGREPAIVKEVALHLDLHLSLRNGCAVVILGLHAHLKLFAQGHRRLGRLDHHLELGLLVFLDTESDMGHRHLPAHDDVVVAEGRVFSQLELEFHAAKLIGLESAEFLDRLVSGVLDLDVGRFAGVGGKLPEVVTGLSGPQLHVNLLAGPIHGTVSDPQRSAIDVLGVILIGGAPVQMAARHVCLALPGMADNVPPRMAQLGSLRELKAAILIRLFTKVIGNHVVTPLVIALLQVLDLVTEELQFALNGLTRR